MIFCSTISWFAIEKNKIMWTSAPDQVDWLQRAWGFTQNSQKYFGQYNTKVRPALDESPKILVWFCKIFIFNDNTDFSKSSCLNCRIKHMHMLNNASVICSDKMEAHQIDLQTLESHLMIFQRIELSYFSTVWPYFLNHT